VLHVFHYYVLHYIYKGRFLQYLKQLSIDITVLPNDEVNQFCNSYLKACLIEPEVYLMLHLPVKQYRDPFHGEDKGLWVL